MSDRTDLIQPDRGQEAIAIHLVNKEGFEAWAKTLSGPQRAALAAQKFDGGGYQVGIVPDGDGWFAVGGVADPDALSSWCMAMLAEALPAGTYRRAPGKDGGGEPGAALFGWQTAQYRFTRYRDDKDAEGPRVLLTREAGKIAPAQAEAKATFLVQDLVNTPAEDMGPAELEAAAEALAKEHGAKVKVTRGDALEQQFPMVHAVGRAAGRSHAPRMIELDWGDAKAPRVAIVGKGVCFDSGGLDIKPASGMLLMKKDMGGAAHALALAGLVMGAGLKVRLQVLVPAVENAVAGNAFRPGDVLKSRKGLTVEIGNTDAEGRLILADALALASESKPDLIIDFATLTGAARVALGPDLPALFTREDATAEALLAGGIASDDPVWRLPLHAAYAEWLKSDIADTNNAHANAFAGSSVAALFLD
jgi:leucyl aminopeptidase